MQISLAKATLQDAEHIHQMQQEAFLPLLAKYQDHETSPANESLALVKQRIQTPNNHFYLILAEEITVGAIRIVIKEEGQRCRISPIFILPAYQNRGIAQQVMLSAERSYPDAQVWELTTIQAEKGNCHLYEKMGYRLTGQNRVINEKMTLVDYEKER